MREILSIDQCEIALQWFKDNGYIVLGSGGMEDGSEGFMITFVDGSGKRVSIFTRSKEIEAYIFKCRPWYWRKEEKPLSD